MNQWYPTPVLTAQEILHPQTNALNKNKNFSENFALGPRITRSVARQRTQSERLSDGRIRVVKEKMWGRAAEAGAQQHWAMGCIRPGRTQHSSSVAIPVARRSSSSSNC